WRDRVERFVDRTTVARPHQPRDLAAVGEEHERRPELDAERTAERPAAAILDLDVANAAVRLERRRDRRLRSAAVAAPRRAEFEQRRSGKRVDFGARRLAHGCCHRLETSRCGVVATIAATLPL